MIPRNQYSTANSALIDSGSLLADSIDPAPSIELSLLALQLLLSCFVLFELWVCRLEWVAQAPLAKLCNVGVSKSAAFLHLQSRRFAATLGELTGGRVGLTCGSVGVLKGAITIAIRYSAGRQQFGPPDSAEVYNCFRRTCCCETATPHH